MSAHGLTSVESRYSVAETIDRLADVAVAAGLLIFARIDHAQGASDAGLVLRPTTLLIFGHPTGGTPLMQENQVVGIDLPVKALAWEDEDGRVWLTYNDATWMADRHSLERDERRIRSCYRNRAGRPRNRSGDWLSRFVLAVGAQCGRSGARSGRAGKASRDPRAMRRCEAWRLRRYRSQAGFSS